MDIQQSLFGSSPERTQENSQQKHHWTLFVDGASRNNPGKAVRGFIRSKTGKAAKDGSFLRY